MSYAIRRLPCHFGRLARPVVAKPTLANNTTTNSTTIARFRHAPPPTSTRIFERAFHISRPSRQDEYEEKARKLNQKGLDEAEQEVRVKQNQVKRPWLREDADKPPAEQRPPANPDAKGQWSSRFREQVFQLTACCPRKTPDYPNPPPEAHCPPPHSRREGQGQQRLR